MNAEFKRYFASWLGQFKTNGPESLRNELPELIRRTNLPDASKAFLHFVADVCTELKDYSSAINLLRLIAAKFALDDVGYNNLAFCLWEMNVEAEAFACYKRSLELNPNSASSLRGACFLAIETDHGEEAVEYCRKATQLAPSSRELAVWFATALSNAGKLQELSEFIAKREIQFGRDEELEKFIGS